MAGIRPEWKQGPEFIEFAEALGCRTDQIFTTISPAKGVWFVLATLDDTDLLFSALMRRDDEEILRITSGPTPRPGMWEQIQEDIRKRMGNS